MLTMLWSHAELLMGRAANSYMSGQDASRARNTAVLGLDEPIERGERVVIRVALWFVFDMLGDATSYLVAIQVCNECCRHVHTCCHAG